MNRHFFPITLVVLSSALSCIASADDKEFEAIDAAMKFVHKAPKGEKKVSDKIIDGTASQEEITKTLALYKAMVDTKPPKGDPAAFKAKVTKVISATEDILAKKEGAQAAFKEAVNCKACHNDFKGEKH